MKLDLKDKFQGIIAKIKKVKHFEIYLAVGLALIIACIYFISIKPLKNDKEPSQTQIDNVSTKFESSGEYIDYLENKLENVITRVKGVENVEVILTLEKGFEYIYATEEETKTTSNGTSITSSNVVMVDGQPVIKEEIYPIVKGIVVIANGVDDINTKMSVLSLIQTVIEVENSKINIMAGK